jgi:hypothetical protein
VRGARSSGFARRRRKPAPPQDLLPRTHRTSSAKRWGNSQLRLDLVQCSRIAANTALDGWRAHISTTSRPLGPTSTR